MISDLCRFLPSVGCFGSFACAASIAKSCGSERPPSPIAPIRRKSRRELLATIDVNTTSVVTNAGEGSCTLMEAINGAITNPAWGAPGGNCGAGSAAGTDTINIPAGTYTLTAVDHLRSGVDPIGLPN